MLMLLWWGWLLTVHLTDEAPPNFRRLGAAFSARRLGGRFGVRVVGRGRASLVCLDVCRLSRATCAQRVRLHVADVAHRLCAGETPAVCLGLRVVAGCVHVLV